MVLGGLDKLRWKRQKEKEEEGESQTDAAMLANYRAQWDEMDEVTKLKLVLKSTQGRRMTLSLQRSMDAYIEWKSNPNGTHNKEERGESLVEALKQRYHYKGLLHRPLPAGARRNLPDLVRPLRNGELLEKLIFSENPNEKDAPRWVRAAPYQATIRATMQATDGGWKQREQNSEWDRQVRKLFEGNDLAGYLAMKNRVGETNNGGGEGDLSDVRHKNTGEGIAPISVDDETIRLWENLRVDSPRHIYVRNMLFETHFRDREKHHRSPKEVESLARDFSAAYDTHLQKIREGVQEKYTTQEHNAHFVEEKVTAATDRYKRELIMNEMESLGQRLEDFMKCVPMLQQALSTMNGTEEASSGGGGIKVRKSANPPRKRGKG
ncbi:hypothetical protein, conserved [Angomonas deanei]|uniref:Uncharacterized protein n=1 Tax=Angomonas deanei TaxID=59799 RepID=A0A7G2CN50_9TRYP|nr:hypothetical protein, conserved [Angomonas deanei]